MYILCLLQMRFSKVQTLPQSLNLVISRLGWNPGFLTTLSVGVLLSPSIKLFNPPETQ